MEISRCRGCLVHVKVWKGLRVMEALPMGDVGTELPGETTVAEGKLTTRNQGGGAGEPTFHGMRNYNKQHLKEQ